jgi:hypothetical protein
MRFIVGAVLVSLTLCGCGGGGGTSSPQQSPSQPTTPTTAPGISTLAPASATAGGSALTLTINGSNFVASSVVQWNGAMLQTSYTSATQLTAQVRASDIASAGTAKVTAVNPAADGGTSTAASFSIMAAQSAVPQLVQWNTFQTTGTADAVNTPVQFTTATKAGDTIWVAVTLSDFAGVHTISVTDTQNNAFTLLDQENDGAPGTQTVAHFYAANIVGDAMTPDTVTVVWTTENYKGVLIAEISGTTAAPLVGHAGNVQDGLGAGPNNVTAGPTDVTSAQTPALLVALSMNTSGGASDTGGSGRGGPTAGSGMTQVGTMLWNWGANLATFETASVTGAESISSTFNSTGTDSYVTVAAVFH